MCKLSEILTKGLQTYAKKKSENELGDRSAYIGASDIPNCPRKVILDKLDSDDHDLETLVRFERGHLAEDIVAKALQSAGYGNFVRQYEVDASEVLGVPIKAHLDFVWFSPNSLSVLEVKTVSSIPDFPYESWEMQLYAQMGLLVLTGIKVPVRGAILALDLNSGQHKVFNGYEHNEEVARGLIERGVFLWEALQAIKMERAEGELETEISNLCAYCKHIATCPRFAGPEIPELEPLASQLQSLRNQQKELKKQADSLQGEIQSILAESKISDWVQAGKLRVRLSDRTRTKTDMKAVTEALAENGIEIGQFQSKSQYFVLEIR